MKPRVRKLYAILEDCEDTGAFLLDVALAVEHLYSESVNGCPDGFRHLDRAIEAFKECESEDDEEDDGDEEDEESDD